MSVLRCPACGLELPPSSRRFACDCGELFDVEHPPAGLSAELLDRRAADPAETSGVWRFRELVDPDRDPASAVSLDEGRTPLLRSRPLCAWAGIDLLRFKHEGRNPTGSFKDRGMTVAVGRALAGGAHLLACASTGNTAASLAAYAAAAGVGSLVLAPEKGTALGKLSQALAHGARTVLIRGDFDQGMALVRILAGAGRVELLNSIDPWRIEGQKTIVLEILQDLGWEPPDWIVFPAGNLGNCSAFGKALREASSLGLVDRLPRLAAVQAAGAAPFARAFEAGFERLEPLEARTIATAIRIGNPVSFVRASRAIRETEGVVTAVDDASIIAAKIEIDRAGIGAEPASAAALAGAKKLVAEGVIRGTDRVVCVLTGHLLKDPDASLRCHGGEVPGASVARENRTVVVDPTAEALEGILSGMSLR